jgi:hypothetical protein
MHDEVTRFPLEGVLTDKLNLAQHKERMVHFLEGDMRDNGFVPLLDMEPHYTQSYDPAGEHFVFKLSVYGVFVGKEKAWDVSGMMSGKIIPKYTPQARLSQRSDTRG